MTVISNKHLCVTIIFLLKYYINKMTMIMFEILRSTVNCLLMATKICSSILFQFKVIIKSELYKYLGLWNGYSQ